MLSTSDTIVAIATPPGRGGIGVVRLSGPGAQHIAEDLIDRGRRLEPRRATLTRLCAGMDQAVVTLFPAPHSYTGEDVVELSVHGSPVVLDAVVRAAIGGGARLANPGEFTLRAFLNGRMDLPQAEAVADLIDAVTPLQARAAFDQLDGTLTRAIADLDAGLFDLIAGLEASIDFSEEGYHFLDRSALADTIGALIVRTEALVADASRGRMIREGLQIAIVGPPNVGKSSLFNVLVGSRRAIVTDVPGTTRDLVTEVVDLDGLRVTMIDTAGLRAAADVVEAEGIDRSRGVIRVADLVIHVVDARNVGAGDLAETSGCRRIVVRNKTDLVDSPSDAPADGVAVSAVTGAGLEELRRAVFRALDVDLMRDRPALTNVRHVALVQRAHDALVRARAVAADGVTSEEFVLADLQDARAAFEEITGRRAADDLLAHIFSRFCIGK